MENSRQRIINQQQQEWEQERNALITLLKKLEREEAWQACLREDRLNVIKFLESAKQVLLETIILRNKIIKNQYDDFPQTIVRLKAITNLINNVVNTVACVANSNSIINQSVCDKTIMGLQTSSSNLQKTLQASGQEKFFGKLGIFSGFSTLILGFAFNNPLFALLGAVTVAISYHILWSNKYQEEFKKTNAAVFDCQQNASLLFFKSPTKEVFSKPEQQALCPSQQAFSPT